MPPGRRRVDFEPLPVCRGLFEDGRLHGDRPARSDRLVLLVAVVYRDICKRLGVHNKAIDAYVQDKMPFWRTNQRVL